ncbi:MAG: NADH:ubiquinone reductase (Na(+)-transporting) subunit C [Flavobacteriales bacterium]|nr:NADH:ubiquinone reductase (Na(+)-transporting) subunit C [Flavobacteriales bacterium]MBP7156524.1 NADH:ubiquinone reductase (Na(+)-transporting) subunit C [Flavobacteriales bacterium]HQV74554.1 NADH:ubiquinone reductase (Na(+)-transporting) subunit C [Flavobacteriales bacterium]HQW39894.1 NADH:ubiquinone reductase (Na(+)-transporting) subunit C [Flavobacteriales bacterium]
MAFDKNSNSFTFIFAIILVCVVGTTLAVAFLALKPAYDENVRREKMQNILAAMNVKVARDDAPAKFTESISGSLLLDANGVVVDGSNRDKASGKSEASPAFDMDVLKQYKDWKANVVKAEDMQYPVYLANVEGHDLMVVPMIGTGLWGPVWGYVAIDKVDGRTIYGSTFDHKGETPGLGAEIATPIFIDQFPGKTISEPDGTYTGIKVYKGGSMTTDPHGVDGISGGTITSQGVDEMLMRTLAIYDVYFKQVVTKTVVPEPVVNISLSDTMAIDTLEIQ